MKDIIPHNDNEWKHYLQEGQKNSVDAILDFGKRIYEFKQNCAKKQGGSEFSQKVKEWLGMSQRTSSYWADIGRTNIELRTISSNLPQSYRAISTISSFTDKQRKQGIDEKVINPEATQADIIAFKNRLEKPEKYESTTENKQHFYDKEYNEIEDDNSHEAFLTDEEYNDEKRKQDNKRIKEEIERRKRDGIEYGEKKTKVEPTKVITEYEASNILGIPGCTRPDKEVLKAIYRFWSSKYHPDKGGDHNKMIEINRAYEIIGLKL